jgi:hypothetical protein
MDYIILNGGLYIGFFILLNFFVTQFYDLNRIYYTKDSERGEFLRCQKIEIVDVVSVSEMIASG